MQGIEAFAPGHLAIIIDREFAFVERQRGGSFFIDFKGFAVQIDKGISGSNWGYGVIFGEEQAVFAKTIGEGLFIIGRPDQ